MKVKSLRNWQDKNVFAFLLGEENNWQFQYSR